MTEQNKEFVLNNKKRRSWVSWAALIAIIMGVTCWFQLAHQQRRTTNNYSQLQSSFHQTLASTAQLTQTTNTLQAQITNQNAEIQALQAALNRLQAMNSGYETDMTLQQVDHYLLQANLNLTFNQDISGAIGLLQGADQRLNALSDPQVIPLRQAVALNIVKLQSIEPIDLVGVLSKLSALRDQAAALPLFAINSKAQMFHQAATIVLPVNSEKKGFHSVWDKAWQKTLETLKSLVIIRNRQTEIAPLISVSQEQFLRQNLQLILQQAEWAVLEHQQGVYQYSLTQASEWIQRYFSDNDQATMAVQADFNQLQKLNLVPKLPDLNPLINQLHSLQLQINKNRTLSIEKPSSIRSTSMNTMDEDVTPAPLTTRKQTEEKEALV